MQLSFIASKLVNFVQKFVAMATEVISGDIYMTPSDSLAQKIGGR